MNLDASFEQDLREAVLDEAEHELIGKPNNLVYQAVQKSHEILRKYGREFDYNVESIIESLGEPELDRSERSIEVRWGWEHEAAPFFALGTSDHTVEGNLVLSFIWEDAPASIHEMFPHTERVDGDPRVFFPEVEVSGLPESRFVRDALNWLRWEVA